MRFYQSAIVAGIVAVVTFESCRSTKKIQTAINKKDTAQAIAVKDSRSDSMQYIREIVQAIRKNTIDYRTFSAKIKVQFEGNDGKKPDFTANLRLRKDSIMWVSVTGLLGIEGLRVLITPDSIKVLNKLDKIAQFRSLAYIQEVTHIPFSFKELQDLVVGNVVYLNADNIVSYKKEDRTISLISIGELFKHLLTVSGNEYLPQHSKLDDVNPLHARTADITYGDYETKNGIRFSTYRRITVSEKTKLDIEMQYKQFDFNVDLSFPFNIPRNFKRQ